MEALPPTLSSASEQPPLYDGTTRLYMSYICPYAQRAWITRNYKGLQEKIKLVPLELDTTDKPAWYKRVYPRNMVPSLEHNNRIVGESLDLIKYMDSHFDGPKLTPDDPERQRLAEELLGYSDTFNRAMVGALISKEGVTAEAVVVPCHVMSTPVLRCLPFVLGAMSPLTRRFSGRFPVLLCL